MSDEPLVPSAEPADDGPVPAPEAEDSGRAPASAPSPLIIDPKEEHLQSLVFLHGLGDSAQGWELYMTDWAEVMPNMRFVLPSAAKRPVTKFAGDECTAWYDLEGFEDRTLETCEGIDSSMAIVEALVKQEEAQGVPRDKIFLGGFSQGAALAAYVAVQLQPPVGGVLILSGYLPHPDTVPLRNPQLPVMICHGTNDHIIDESNGHRTNARLSDGGFTRLTLKIYPGLGHWTQLSELNDCQAWLKGLF